MECEKVVAEKPHFLLATARLVLSIRTLKKSRILLIKLLELSAAISRCWHMNKTKLREQIKNL